MKVFKFVDRYELRPENEVDCEFIDYIEGTKIIVGGMTSKSKVGENYNIRGMIRETTIKSRMKPVR